MTINFGTLVCTEVFISDLLPKSDFPIKSSSDHTKFTSVLYFTGRSTVYLVGHTKTEFTTD